MTKKNPIFRIFAIICAVALLCAVFVRRMNEETSLVVATIEERVKTLNAIIPQTRHDDISLYWEVLGTLDFAPIYLSLKDSDGKILLEQNVQLRDSSYLLGSSSHRFAIEFNGQEFGVVNVLISGVEIAIRVLLRDWWYFGIIVFLVMFVVASEWIGVRLTKRQYEEGLRWLQNRFPSEEALTSTNEHNNEVPHVSSPAFLELLECVGKLINNNKELVKNSAIASMTQMVAHDVRKPFSLVKSALSILNHASNIEDVRKNMRVIGPSIEKALTSVNGMLEDIMEIGRTEKPVTEATSLIAILDASLHEVFQVHQSVEVGMSYRFLHQHALEVEFSKIQRAISNIVGNAVQAMKGCGNIWFETLEKDGFVILNISNSGPLIPEEDLPKIFDAFYSKGKKGGTGLGLAIARKVAVAHGGTVNCGYTHDRKFVEFTFYLPVADAMEEGISESLFQSSKQYIDAMASLVPKSQSVDSFVLNDPREAEFEARILDAAKKLGRPIELAMIDDEPLYRAALRGLVGNRFEIAAAIQLKLYDNSADILSAAFSPASIPPDCIVCDIDLSSTDPLDGFGVVEELRIRGFSGRICVHSNRSSLEDSKKGLNAGADLILPKPMSRAHLLGFIAAAVPSANVAAKGQEPHSDRKPLVVVVDDDALMLMGWEMELGADVDVILAESVDELMSKLDSDSGIAARITCVITDFWLGEGSCLDQDIVGKLCARNYNGPILLSSNTDADCHVSVFTAAISKQAVNWDSLKKILEESESRRKP